MTFKIPKKLIEFWEVAFINKRVEENIENKFKCISKVLRAVEYSMEESQYKFLTKNPLLKHDALKDKVVLEVEESCLNFLLSILKSGKRILFRDSVCALAQTYLGIAYELGAFGLNKDLRKAYSYYSTSSRQNNPLGTFRLALCYEKGLYKGRSIEKALTFHRYAAKLGLMEAMHTYGAILIYGDLNSKRDSKSGLFYLKMAVKMADEDYPFPYYDLARVFETDNAIPDILPDDIYSFTLYEKGARLGCPNCQYRVGRAYEFGELGREKILKDAITWYLKAAKYGQTDAQLGISTFYFTGVPGILERNYSEAYMWALKAAVKGHKMAAYCVADYIENGIGIKQDKTHALWWYTISGILGNTRAKAKVIDLKKQTYYKKYEKKGCNIF